MQAISNLATSTVFIRNSRLTLACRSVVLTYISYTRTQVSTISLRYGMPRQMGGGFRTTTQKETGRLCHLLTFFFFCLIKLPGILGHP